MKPDNNLFKKESTVLCVNSGNFFHPNFDLIEGKSYLVHDVIVRPSLFGRHEIKFVFLARDGSLVEINSKRIKRME